MNTVKPLRVGVLASGGGTNMQAIIDRTESGELNAQIATVISNNSDAGALERARRHGIPALHLSSRTHRCERCLDSAISEALKRHAVEWVLLAGYMKHVGPHTLQSFRDRILNIHPALLPKHGGPGMYGMRVHEAVIAAADTESGVTVHLVTGEYDAGPIVAQRRIPVHETDTPETLQKRVLAEEHHIYGDVLHAIVTGTLTVEDGKPSTIIR